jgi:hypothetical protein
LVHATMLQRKPGECYTVYFKLPMCFRIHL